MRGVSENRDAKTTSWNGGDGAVVNPRCLFAFLGISQNGFPRDRSASYRLLRFHDNGQLALKVSARVSEAYNEDAECCRDGR